jgi:predicted cupin superfamily sugar epimerase
LNVEKLKNLLGLKPHPQEGGWYVRTYESTEFVPAPNFTDGRYDGSRRTSTAIYYLLEPETFSEMHLLQSDEIFHFYAGDPVEMLQLSPDGTGKRVLIGNDFASSERPQVLVERGIWQGSRLVPGGAWALLGCTVSPGFEFADYSEGKRTELIARWPEWASLIAELTRSS